MFNNNIWDGISKTLLLFHLADPFALQCLLAGWEFYKEVFILYLPF